MSRVAICCEVELLGHSKVGMQNYGVERLPSTVLTGHGDARNRRSGEGPIADIAVILLTAKGAACAFLQIDRDFVDLAGELEWWLVGEVYGRADILADVHSFAY
jgi:hypothetical protein